MNQEYQKCLQAANYIKNYFDPKGAIGIVLGSGLGDFASKIENPKSLDYKDIPGFKPTTVSSHAGKLIYGQVANKRVLCMQGRFHYYEGHDMNTVVLPIRVMKILGIETVILTNAAGGCNTSFKPGTLMLIDDYINYQNDTPLRGENIDELGTRFPDMSGCLPQFLKDIAFKASKELNIDLKKGVYMSFKGPQFESKAEIKFAQIIGADAVGMSTVPEIIAARHAGMNTLAISCITNMAAGLSQQETNHQEVIETTLKVKDEFIALLSKIIELI